MSMSQSSSGIPLPRSFSKQDSRSFSAALLTPAGQSKSGRSSSASSVSSLSVSKEFLKGTSLRSPRAPFTPADTNSSPNVPKREMIPQKSPQGLRRGSLPQDRFRDVEKHTNQNWRSGHRHFRSLDNESESGQRRPSNGNVLWETSADVQRHVHKQRTKLMAYPDGGTKSWVRNTSRESPQMAAVPPFRFRLQVQEDAEASLEDLSGCSSDWMEVCWEDLADDQLQMPAAAHGIFSCLQTSAALDNHRLRMGSRCLGNLRMSLERGREMLLHTLKKMIHGIYYGFFLG